MREPGIIEPEMGPEGKKKEDKTDPKKTVLIVDDYPILARILGNILLEQGYRVHIVFSGSECIEKLESLRPDLILLDIFMEPMDGVETLRRIRAEQATCDIPVIILSAKQLTPADVDEFSGRIDDYIIKPVLSDYLVDTLSGFFERRRTDEEINRAAEKVGIDPVLINEYIHLSHNIYLYRRFLRHLDLPLSAGNTLVSSEEDTKLWLDNVNQTILVKEKRFSEINEILKLHNVIPRNDTM